MGDSRQTNQVINVDTAVIFEHYDQAENWCKTVIKEGNDISFDNRLFNVELKNAASQFGFPLESLISLFRNIHLVHVKKRSYIIKNETDELIAKYVEGLTILELAKEKNFPPYLLSRIIVQKITCFGQKPNSRKAVTEAMRDPKGKLCDRSTVHHSYQASEDFKIKIQDVSKKCSTRLAHEVIAAVEADPLYGPKFDKERQLAGLEHEILLEQSLITMGIPFETEEQLRIRGTSRTPDVLLLTPVGIKVRKRRSMIKSEKSHVFDDKDDDMYEWKMVCWIDSKALFGDISTHEKSVLPQAETYVHRFGPGLIIYWYGHAPYDRLGDAHGDVCVSDWSVPYDLMLPDGEMITSSKIY